VAGRRWYASEGAEGRIVVAADVPSLGELGQLLRALGTGRCWIKVGLELFSAAGPAAVRACRQAGLPVFLDLKLCDIPNTVAGAVGAAAGLGVGLLTLHAGGGRRMLAAAVERARQLENPPALLAVTVLTSLDQQGITELGWAGPVSEQVERLAGLALECGIDGLVCSAREAGRLRRRFGPRPLLVTPGIRPAGAAAGDQARVSTPAAAVAAGADLLVIGRPITRAPDPAAALAGIAAEIT